MNKILHTVMAVALLLCCGSLTAQTSYTSRITNPSFESGFTGWTYANMQTQTNTSFKLKAGNTYVEKWVNRGSAVGDASLSQRITGLVPGNYQLTVAAQNIQQDTPTAAQTGAYIFADDKQTTVTVTDQYTVDFDYVSGAVEIGFKAVNASGNYMAVDNFRLVKTGDDLSAVLATAITKAKATLGDGSGKKADQLQQAISDAEALASTATAQQQADAIVALQEAEGVYQRANASDSNPLDFTSYIVNPSFETGDFTGWKQEQMQMQSNTSFSIKAGTYYVEKWVDRGQLVGDAAVYQTITGLYPGRYRMRVAAQNIQQDYTSRAQTGACLYANSNQLVVTTRKQYTLEFVLTGTELEIGFRAVGATGNYLSVDNFRLEYLSDSQDEIRTALETLLANSRTLAEQRINSTALSALNTAIGAAQTALDSSTDPSDWAAAASQLESAYAQAQTSSSAFAKLQDAITDAQSEIDADPTKDVADYQTAVNNAKEVYENTATTDVQAEAAVAALADAAFAFKIANGTGPVPTVKTDPRFIKGATWAFGRSTVSGSNIIERGFCWSESPDPKVTDHRTTEYLSQQGTIYWLRDLKPATMYYMRAYAITKDYAVGYGDIIKFATVPKGNIGAIYNSKSGDPTIDERIGTALDRAMNYYWNNLSSIYGITINVNYSPGTPTADCSYGGWMRMGTNPSYQRIGTIMHESLHGIGVGTHSIWGSSEMRANGDRGDWLGDRVTEAVRFWDNSTTATISGDHMHLWPYGCNGANEDTGTDNLYVMMGILAQALNEDGLPGSSSIGYALPYYSFTHDDDVKYYIKSEDETYGRSTAYLVETTAHQLQWKEMSADEALADDAAAWYITFTPSNQYYQLRNAKTGYYMTYNSTGTNGFRTVSRTGATQTNDNIHLMRGRAEVKAGTVNTRGYYFIHPAASTANPTLLTPISNGRTATGNFNISKSATEQRWMILTGEEALAFDSGVIDGLKKELNDMIALIRTTAATPHVEMVEKADATLATQLEGIEALGQASSSTSEVRQLISDTRAAGMDFLGSVSSSLDQPFDLTFLITNPNFTTSATEGWTCAQTPNYGAKADEFFEKTFDFYQILSDMPVGDYLLKAQAFQRTGEVNAAYTAWSAGTANVTTTLYLVSTLNNTKVKHICDDAQASRVHTDDKQIGNSKWVPNTMNSAGSYFAKNLYDNSIEAKLTTRGNLRIGLRCTSAPTAYWSMFDNFRLYYYGDKSTATGVKDITVNEDVQDMRTPVIYDLQGRLIADPSLMTRGIYIVNGRKVFVK